MIKNTILAENFDGESVAQTCWFNLTRKEVVDFLIEESQQDSVFARSLLSGESTPENLRVVDGITAYQFFVRLVDRSFGERDQDGIHFRKSEKALKDFKESVFYEEFLFDLVNDPKKAVKFFNGVMPKKMIEDARKANPEAFKALGA